MDSLWLCYKTDGKNYHLENSHKILEYLGSVDHEVIKKRITVVNDPYEAMENAHAVAVLTEWDEFVGYDWELVYEKMMKPGFLFDGKEILDKQELDMLGFKLFRIGK